MFANIPIIKKILYYIIRMSLLLENNNQFQIMQRNAYNSYLKNIQNQTNDKIYPNKKPSDKIKCIVCDGHYTRSKKCVHDKSKKHIAALNHVYDKLKLDEFYNKVSTNS